MRNFTFRKSNLSKLVSFIFLLLISYNASAQFYKKHYIAPAPWQYFSKANEIVIATNSTATVSITIAKSDGSTVATVTATKGAPAIYRFAGKPSAAPAFPFNTVLNAAGLIVTGTEPISINLRNVASDALGGDGTDQDIKGNAALTSFGDAGIGVRFRVGYYRDGTLGNFNNYGDQRPIYSVMAITAGTTVKIGDVVTATLNAGQSYLFKAPIGTLVETSNPSVMNTSAAIDTPGGCGDAAYNQIPPESVLGSEYFIERGKGNDTAEQTTVIATKPNTKVVVESYSVTGALISSQTTTLANAGSFFTFLNGVKATNFSASRVLADNNVVVYSGTAQSCEVDISTIAPVSECGGSKFIETAKFRNYGTGSLPYFGYILLKDATSTVYINGANIEQKAGIAARHQLGTTGWYLINFEDTQIGSPDILSISSDAKLTVSIVQQGGGFSMAGFFSNFAAQPEDPTLAYVAGGGCTNSTASLTTPSGFAPYQWYFNGTAISGATSNTYSATKTGSYSVASTLACGAQTQSKPVTVTLCTDLGVTNTVDNATPCVGSNVEFTIKISNLGVNNASGVSVNDLLPTGYAFVSSTPSVGNYNGGTGVWSIGDLDGGVSATLKIVAKVNASGVYNNTATIPASATDTNSSNNSASVSTTPNPLPVLVITNPTSVCSPSKVDITAPAVTAGSSSNLTFTYWTNATATTAYATPTQATAGTYYIKATTAQGCTDVKPVVVTVATPPNSGTVAGNQNVCLGGTTTFTSNGSTGGTWSSDNTSVATVNATSGAITTVAVGTATITYTVKGSGGCADANSTRVVTVNAIPTATISGTLTACYTTTLTAVTNAASPAYVWYKDNVVISNQTSSTLVVTADGDYKVKVTNTTTTCEQTSAASTVKVSDTQKPTITCPANVTTSPDTNSCVATGVVLGTPTTSDNCSGTVTVTNNAPTSFPIGLTTVTWTATDAAGNTQTCTQTVTIVNPIKANDDTVTSFNGYVGGVAVSSVLSNDVLRCGNSIQNDVTITLASTLPSALNFDTTTGEVSVKPQTPAGTYTFDYKICEKADATNCSTATVKITVVAPVIDAVIETTTSINGAVGGTTASLITNDTLNGSPAVIGTANGQVTLTGVTVPTGLTLNANGTVTIAANTPAGNYNLEYSICEVTNPTNCDTATSIIVVGKPVIDAVTETTTSINGAVGGTTASVILNDTLNGNSAVIGTANGQVTLTGVTVPAGLTLNANGTVTIAANTPAGSYNLEYSICEVTNPTNCDTETSIIVVGKPVIDAVTETTTSINGAVGGTTASVILNDTLNGSPAVIGTANGQVTLTGVTVPTGLTLNADGTVTIAANTPAGNYNLEYSICEVTNPTNCDTATSIIVVGKPIIDAVIETTTSINGAVGGTTASVILNDTLNGSPAVIGTAKGQVTLTGVTVPTGLTLNADGTVTIAANTPAGNYNLEYSICEITNPTNCDTATSIIVVGKPVIDAVTETTTSINGAVGGTTASVILNDTLNGSSAVIGTANGQVTLTGVTVPAGLTLNANGTVTIAANTLAGNYNLEYSICEVTNPTNCDTATSIIVVGKPVIDAVTETTTSINGMIGGTTASVILNDTLNGSPAVIGTANGEVTLTGVTVPTGLTLNTDGTVTIAANTPAGNYNLEYSICEVTNPTNCDTATSIIVVGKPVIDAVTETTTSINGMIGGTTASLITNDTLNGSPAVIGTANGQVTLTAISVPAGLTLNADGTVTIATGTTIGDYEVEYNICEVTNPTNCDAVKSIISVTGSVLVANNDKERSVIATNKQEIILNALDNDTKDGLAVVASDVEITIITPDPTGFITLNNNGTVTLNGNAPAGTYEIIYQICEHLNNTNCSAAASIKITVTAPVIDAVTETTTSIDGNVGGTTISLLDNDTLNGNPVSIGIHPGDVTLTAISVPAGLTLNADGTVTVSAGTTAGNYEVEYRICEVNNPTNCDAVKSIVPVTRAIIKANNDEFGPIDSSKPVTTAYNIFDNDFLNGLKVSAQDVVLRTTIPNANFSLNADGSINVVQDTPTGTYHLTYEICEKANLSNCSTATVDLVVFIPIVLLPPSTQIVTNNDALVSVDGINGSLDFINVLDNDLLNGAPINPSDVIITNTSGNANFEFNADGTVSVKPNTPGGNYTLTYQVCEKANASNCSSATLTVFVEFPSVAIVKTATFNDENANGHANAGETITYRFKVTNTGNVALKNVTVADPLTGVVLSGQAFDLGINEINDTNYSAQYTIKQSDINFGSVSNQATVSANSVRGVVVDDKSDDSSDSEDRPTIVTLGGCEINVMTGFSPNGDGKNARFYIKGLECYPDNTVEIYNRWGVLVFDIDHYNNEDRVFLGYSQGRTTVKQSDGLPVGTYYYILKYKDSDSRPHEKSGYLYLNK
ncbi:T9SS type B sorting domain-containing protein [Flavobacterium hercynium]|uniref:HYR domain-containing protein n=1 Tax=Flavobacterium hercynium TaxID=387094 RepID=A0A226HPR7_9FLAO|nr:gliding motility-associated C-terminal domain-containing protein [Flavobacterium hercynium]OXA96273.1 hypothetical protein B0A66_01490 [Flavobacterium hercynium]